MDNEHVKSLWRFDAYDIFGYLIPGATTLVGVYVHGRMFGVDVVFDKTKEVFPDLGGLAWHESLIWILLFTMLAYITGHLVASISSLVMDKWVVERIYGFPYQRLFKNYIGVSSYERQKRCFYKGMMGLMLGFLIYLAVRSFDRISLYVLIGLGVVVLIKVGFTVLNQRDIRTPYAHRGEESRQYRFAAWCWKYVIRWWLMPLAYVFDLVCYSLLSFWRLQKPFYPEVQAKFVEKFEEKFGVNPEEAGTDVFWLTYCYLCQNKPACTRLIQHWLNLYGFGRNLAVAFFLLFIYGVIMKNFYTGDPYDYLTWCLLTGIGAVLFGLRYYYIYYNYFSKFVFRAFVSATV